MNPASRTQNQHDDRSSLKPDQIVPGCLLIVEDSGGATSTTASQ